MNDNQQTDDVLLGQIDKLLDQGKPHDEPLVNTLAHTRPQADQIFQHELERTLMARLQTQKTIPEKENESMHLPLITHRPRPILIAPLTGFATLAAVAILLVGIMLVNLNRAWVPLSPETPAAVVQVDQRVSLVIATQNIEAGTVISANMVGVVSLSQADVEKLGITQPDHELIADVQEVIGQTAAVDMLWFQPIETALLGEPIIACNTPNTACSDLPEGYSTIGLFTQPDFIQGLEMGDRVDVFAPIDGQIRLVTSNVLLSEIQDEMVMLAVPDWQLGVLARLSQRGESIALRPHTGDAPKEIDTIPDEYTLTLPDTTPLDFVFDLIVSVPAAQGYLLTNLPAPIDHLPFTSNGDTLYFRFNHLELVSITPDTSVTIRLSQSDSANLDYLLGLGMDVSFVPDEETYR